MPQTPSPVRRLPPGEYAFGEFRIDPASGRLWRGAAPVHLRPKTWEVLCLMLANPGRLLTKEELLEAVWPGVVVGDTMPGISVAELRRALDDDARRPRYIETVHRRGFRFLVPAEPIASGADDSDSDSESRGDRGSATGTSNAGQQAVAGPRPPSPGEPTAAAGLVFVGRTAELKQLRCLLDPAATGPRLALIHGEAGIGKTSLVERLLEDAGSPPPFLVGRGQCLAHFGEGYPYLPIVDALRDMRRSRGDLDDLLPKLAPSWLVRLPELTPVEGAEDPQQRDPKQPASQAIQEMYQLLHTLGPTVWVLEDLHWADEATLEWIALLAQSPGPWHFRLIATARLTEAIARNHGLARLRRELQRRGQCLELAVEGLHGDAIKELLQERFPGTLVPDGLPRQLLERTGGNPLYLVHTVEHLEQAGVLPIAPGARPRRDLAAALETVPLTLRDMVLEEARALQPPARAVLEAGSLAGLQFDAATAALAMPGSAAEVDRVCTDLARHGALLERIGDSTWPDGSVSGRYAFRHALYQKVFYDDQAPASRREAHRRIGAGLSEAWSARQGEVAAMVADHFERGGDAARAIEFHRKAADESVRRHAAREAALSLRRALALLPRLEDGAALEAQLLVELGRVLPALQGFNDPDLLNLYLRARSLRSAGDDAGTELATIAGLLLANLMQRRPEPAEELARELLEMAADQGNATARAYAELCMGGVLYHRGDLPGTIAHAERALEAAPAATVYGPIDVRVTAMLLRGPALWQAGRPGQGLAQSRQALQIAREEADPFNVVVAMQPLVAVLQWCGDVHGLEGVLPEFVDLVETQGITQAQACTRLHRAWLDLQRGDRDQAADDVAGGLVCLEAYGSMMQSVYLLAVAAEVLAGLGRIGEAFDALDAADAGIRDGAARWWEPEIHRLRGTLLVSSRQDPERAVQCLQRALEIAREQGSVSLLLRAATSAVEAALATDGEVARVDRDLLDKALSEIRGGDDTADVRRARKLCDDLS